VDEHATRLAEAVSAAVPGWVERSVDRVLALTGTAPTPAVAEQAAEAARRAQAEVSAALNELLEADIDEQPTTPLTIVRRAVVYPTDVLREAGVAPVARDDTRRRLFPDDDYDLSPAALSELDEALTEPALAWGASKAYAHLQRHGR
jgi:hypothetical protein